MAQGTLFIVATPIGNLEDITLRALETLKTVDIILCEDTRVTKNLLDRYSINKQLLSYHHHSDARKMKEITTLLLEGKNLALVTDAGTPGISDPGNELIQALVKHDEIIISPIPGPSAAVAALSIAGFPTDKFLFLGFPPHKNKRQQFFKHVGACEYAVVFFESGHRIKKCVDDLLANVAGDRKVVVCRELTKKFETMYRTTIEGLKNVELDERGEFVVVVNAQ